MTSNQIAYNNYLENKRHSQAIESESYRHNKQDEEIRRLIATETSRHNIVGESIDTKKLSQDYELFMRNLENQWNIARNNSSANVLAAQLGAEASKFAALTNAEAQRAIAALNNSEQMSRLLAQIASSESIAAENRLSSEEIAMSEQSLREQLGRYNLGGSLVGSTAPILNSLLQMLIKSLM